MIIDLCSERYFQVEDGNRAVRNAIDTERIFSIRKADQACRSDRQFTLRRSDRTGCHHRVSSSLRTLAALRVASFWQVAGGPEPGLFRDHGAPGILVLRAHLALGMVFN